MMVSLFMYIPVLISLGILVFAIYSAITVLKLMRRKNEYLKEICEEIKKK